jgi:GT2 family glycosyltransferase
MIDTDIAFPPGLLTRLTRVADPDSRPLVTGLYASPDPDGGPPVPMIFNRAPGAEPEYTPRRGWTAGNILDVDGCGAGCLLIHRRVLEAIAQAEPGDPAPWFRELRENDRDYGEDLSFCLRAARAGFTITADTGAQAGHVKPVMVGPAGIFGHRGIMPAGADQWAEQNDEPGAVIRS